MKCCYFIFSSLLKRIPHNNLNFLSIHNAKKAVVISKFIKITLEESNKTYLNEKRYEIAAILMLLVLPIEI